MIWTLARKQQQPQPFFKCLAPALRFKRNKEIIWSTMLCYTCQSGLIMWWMHVFLSLSLSLPLFILFHYCLYIIPAHSGCDCTVWVCVCACVHCAIFQNVSLLNPQGVNVCNGFQITVRLSFVSFARIVFSLSLPPSLIIGISLAPRAKKEPWNICTRNARAYTSTNSRKNAFKTNISWYVLVHCKSTRK